MSSQINFTCKNCGSHEINVVWHVNRNYSRFQQLYCIEDCGNANELAADKSYHREERYKCWGPLAEDHRFTKEGEELIETIGEIETEDIICEDCSDGIDEDDWFYHEDDDFGLKSDFYVHCGGCNREIEFGWSHPDREGRIWPVECEDFNQRKSWPEPRFRESWEKRNWIRPDSQTD